MGLFLPGLVYMNISRNGFEGNLPPSMQQMRSLHWLDVSNNKFYGNLPISIFNNIPTLHTLFLANDNFNGSIEEYGFQNELSYLDISNNMMWGKIPIWIGTLKSLRYIQMSKNRFTGELPQEICSFEELMYLDVSQNQLSGGVPSCFNASSLEYLYMQQNKVQIRALNFSHNKLVGPIPKEFSHLKQLESLDLSNNLLSGNIPVELGGIDSLSTFNVSYNNLSGMIPSLPKFSTYQESSYYGNPDLCGLYIQHKCSRSILAPSPQPANLEEEVHGVLFIDMETFFWSFGASYVVILLGFVAVLYINPQWRQRWFYFVEDCYYYVCNCISQIVLS